MNPPDIKDRRTLLQEWIRRVVAYTDQITWFGPNSVARAFGAAFAAHVESAYLLYVALVRRYTLLGSSGAALAQVALEHGTRKLAAQPAKCLIVFQPVTTTVTAITTGPPDLVEVSDSTRFQVGDSIRIRSADGSVTELCEIAAITTGTGPNGKDELELVTALVGTYNPSGENVLVLFRAIVPMDTLIRTGAGVYFQTVEATTTGDANPVLSGESLNVGLADKAWAECTTKGLAGNIETNSVVGLVTAIRGVTGCYNPEPGTGGLDEESDYDLQRRAMNSASLQNQETGAWLQAMAQEGDNRILRVLQLSPTTLATMRVAVLDRNGGTVSSTRRTALEVYIGARTRSYMGVSVSNLTLTSVEVEASITLQPGKTLEEVYRDAAGRLVAYLDYRFWVQGTDVDNADLLSIVNTTPGVATLQTSSFLPATPVVVAAESFPTLVRLSLRDLVSGQTLNADLAVSF